MNNNKLLGFIWIFISLSISLFLLSLSYFVHTGILSPESVNKYFKLKYGPRMIGGEVLYSFTNELYIMNIHEEVYEGIIPEGFVQIMFYPTGSKLPDTIIETIDYNNDRIVDFNVIYDVKNIKAKIEIYNDNVLGNDESWMIFFKETRGLRVRLKKN